MTTLQPMPISPIGPRDPHTEIKTMMSPTTPRTVDQASHNRPTFVSDDQSLATPTRDSFAAANGKRSLPTSPTSSSRPHDVELSDRSELTREGSQRSTHSQPLQDIDMDGSEGEDDISENDSNDETSERPSKKKKKGQRFFCKDYPPCNLSFTRSEHLARHIRKHTGERPFQCHCARRFSRLDNLRQHAQTVHVNEEIPGDSLAATGTRFQRQIRTDRVRPPGPRARASTASSQGSSHRGHGRNLSTSSIGSTTSNASTMSTISTLSRENSGHRPHSMTLSDQQSPRGGLTIDTLRASPSSAFSYTNQSQSGTNTPTSYSYSNTPSSPFGSTLGSPVSIPRNAGPWSDRAGRRLSVPSGMNPFQAHPGSLQSQSYMNPLAPANSSHMSASGSGLTSPSSSTYSFPRNENEAEPDWRRRTWHSSTFNNYAYQRPATSGLSYSQTPDAPRPAFAPQALTAVSQTPKLPGIETFDQISRGSVTPPQQAKGPTQPRTPGRLSLFPSTATRHGPHQHRRNHLSWDISLHQNLTKLDIASGTPPKEPGAWGQQVLAEMQNAASLSSKNLAEQSQQPQPVVHQALQQSPLQPLQELPQRPSGSDSNARVKSPTPQQVKRGGWYPGTVPKQVISAQRPSSEDSSSSEGIPTPANTAMEYQPSIVHASGYIEPQPTYSNHTLTRQGSHRSIFPSPELSRGFDRSQKPDTSGLDALVAAATSESENRAQSLAVRR